MPVAAQLAAGRPVEMGVGQIMEDNRMRDRQQVALALEQLLLDGFAMAPQLVADAIGSGQAGTLAAIEAKQFEGRRVVMQPAPRLAFAGRVQGPGDDQRLGDRPVAGRQAELAQHGAKPQTLQRLAAQPLAADRADLLLGHTVQLDPGFALAGAGL